MSQPAKLVLLALFLPAVAFAQVPVHDLELQIIVDPPGVTPPGSTGTVTITVTNHGPDPTMPFTPGFWEVFAGSDLIPFSFKYGELIDYNRISPLADCRINAEILDLPPGQPLAVGYGMFMPTINPGESRTCEATFTVNPAAFAPDFEMAAPWAIIDGRYTGRWVAGAPPGYDPNFDNNWETVVHVLAAPPIPTLGHLSLVAFALLLAFAALRVVRR